MRIFSLECNWVLMTTTQTVDIRIITITIGLKIAEGKYCSGLKLRCSLERWQSVITQTKRKGPVASVAQFYFGVLDFFMTHFKLDSVLNKWQT